jgi:hypothetical protein
MAKGWFIKNGDRISGPFPATHLKRLVKGGRLAASDLLSKDKPDGPWRQAGSVSGLFSDGDLSSPEVGPQRKRPPAFAQQPAETSSGSGAKVAILSIVGTLLAVGLGIGVYFLAAGGTDDSQTTTVAELYAAKDKSVDSTENTDNQLAANQNGDPENGQPKTVAKSTTRSPDVSGGSGPAGAKQGLSDDPNPESANGQPESNAVGRPRVSNAEQASIRNRIQGLNQEYLKQNAELLSKFAARDNVTQAENTQFIEKFLLRTKPEPVTPEKLTSQKWQSRLDAIRKARSRKDQGDRSPVKALMAHLNKYPPPVENIAVVLQTLLAFEDCQDLQAMQCIVDLRTYLNKHATEKYQRIRSGFRPEFKKSVETRLLPKCDRALEKIIRSGGRYASDWKHLDLVCELTLNGTEGQKRNGRTPLIKIAQIAASLMGTTVYPVLKRNLDQCRDDGELSGLLRPTIVRGLKVGASSESREFEVHKTLIQAYRENGEFSEIVEAAVAEFTHVVMQHAASKGFASYTDIEPVYLGNASDERLGGPAAAAAERALNLCAISEGLEMYPLFRHIGSGKGGVIPIYFNVDETPLAIRTGRHSDDVLRAAARTAARRLDPLPEFADEWVSERDRVRVLPSGKTIVMKDDGFSLGIVSGTATVFRVIDSDSMLCRATFVERSNKRRTFKVTGYPTSDLADEDSIPLVVCTIGSIKLGTQTILHCIPSVIVKSPMRYAEYAEYKLGTRR